MRRLLVLVLVGAAAASGCSLLKKRQADAGADGGLPTVEPVATSAAGPSTGAKNEASVLRYPTETKVDNETATIGRDLAKVRTFPGTGGEVATLGKGTSVVVLAKYFATGVLVLFDDPAATDGSKLLGWLPPEALASAADAQAPAVTGAPGGAVSPVGSGAKALTVDAGAKPGPDAGAKAPTAASGGPTLLLQVLPTAGKCPAGFALVGPFCKRPCNADGDCPRGAFCVSSAGRKTCSATR
jgi:hypothetical protein